MKKIAIYGYGKYGKRTSESFRYYWGGEYCITAIFDSALVGEEDAYWSLSVLSPEHIAEEYKRETFDAVMICIYAQDVRNGISRQLNSLGIPVFVPGSPEDFSEAEAFSQVPAPLIIACEEDYSIHVFNNMLGAVADFERLQFFFLFEDNGKINIDSYKNYDEYYKPLMLNYPFRLRDPLPEKIYMEGSYCVITKAFSNNYWHFTFETADCVYILEQTGFKGKYIYNDTAFSRELLLILGISPERLISTKELAIHKVYAFEKLFDINHRRIIPKDHSREIFPRMAESIKGKLKLDEKYPQKIYVKRIGVRKLLNAEEIAANNGYSIIIPEEHTLLEQMNFFYNADIVLCPHGANSTNFLYMRKNAVFIEIFSDRWYKDINRLRCENLGVHYLKIVGKSKPDDLCDQFADYFVDENALQQIIMNAEEIRLKSPSAQL